MICILINYFHMFAGVLALQLLPRNSSLKIVVITDGMIAAPDINALDNLLVIYIEFLSKTNLYIVSVIFFLL